MYESMMALMKGDAKSLDFRLLLTSCQLGYLRLDMMGLHQGYTWYMAIMENKMEITIQGLELRVWGIPPAPLDSPSRKQKGQDWTLHEANQWHA